MLRPKKAQAAMEFLMTYGWAILVVLAAIAALAYFGVLSPDRFLPEQCTLPSGVACLDFTVGGTSTDPLFTLRIQNSAGFDMSNPVVQLVPQTGSCTADSSQSSLVDGGAYNFQVNCSGQTAGKFKGDVQMNYTNAQTQLAHTKVGTLIAEIT